MVDRQSKDSYYQQQLAQAAWFSRAGYPGSAHNFPAGGSAGMSGHSGTNHYENYMQQLQQFASAQAAQTAADRQSMFSGSSNPFLGIKDGQTAKVWMVYGVLPGSYKAPPKFSIKTWKVDNQLHRQSLGMN